MPRVNTSKKRTTSRKSSTASPPQATKQPSPSEAPSFLVLPFDKDRNLANIPTDEQPDDELLIGYQFGQTAVDKTPYDFLSDAKTKKRPGDYIQQPPSGVSKTDLSNGVKDYHVLPPIAIWEKGKWFYKLEDKLQKSITQVNNTEAWDAWVVTGEGTPGNFLIRAYIVPDTVSQYMEPGHPFYWTAEEVMKGNGKATTYGGPGRDMYGYGYQAPAASTPKPPPAPSLPAGIHFRCPGCGHWFPTETKLAGHSSHCCPGSDNWNDQEGADWIIECECCPTFDMTAVRKEGFPRAAKKKEEASPSPSSMDSTPVPTTTNDAP